MHDLALLLQSQPDSQAIKSMVLAMFAIFPLIMLIVLAIIIVPTWFVCKKAGFSPWLSLLVIVPLGGMVLLYVLAFSEWKVVPVSTLGWTPQPPYPPQPPYTPQPPFPPQA
jgi:hypothetical protein